MKVVTVIGARPQFIKAAVVSRVLSGRQGCTEIVIHTGQHYDENMSEVFFRELEIPTPDFNLEVGSGSHGYQTAKMLQGIEEILCDVRPDWLLVYGDTNSTIAGALAASKLHIPVAHVEAGLRSYNRSMPEEINRVLTDHASDLLLAPTETAVSNMKKEGIATSKILNVGDVMFDAVLRYKDQAKQCTQSLIRLGLESADYLLATVHRAENTDDSGRLKAIFRGLVEVAQKIPVIVPLHPRTKHKLQQEGMFDEVARALHIISPVGYLEIMNLISNAKGVVTDSGGMQKEAYFCNTRCITLRDETEWVELVDLGWNCLLSPVSQELVADGILQFLQKEPTSAVATTCPFGAGRASEKVVDALVDAQFITSGLDQKIRLAC